MRKTITLLIGGLSFLAANFGNAQQIAVSKDSLFFPTYFSYDTLFVYNTGSDDLLIDSLFSVHEEYSYRLDVFASDTTIHYVVDGGHDPFHLTIKPTDSAMFVFEAPDLCSICKVASTFEYFEDSLILMSNSITNDSLLIFSYGEGYPSALSGATDKTPGDFVLFQNYPNPFNSTTKIRYLLPVTGFVRLSVFNILGKKLATLVSAYQAPGTHSVTWDAARFPSGVYYYRLEVDKKIVRTKKLVLLK